MRHTLGTTASIVASAAAAALALAGVVTVAPTDAATLPSQADAVIGHAQPTTRPLATPAATPRSSRVLVTRVYWRAAGRSILTTPQTRRMVFTRGNAWWNEVSGGRYRISGTVTPWIKIPKPDGLCILNDYDILQQAYDRVKRRGLHPERYDRIVIVTQPCGTSGGVAYDGFLSIPAALIWGTTDPSDMFATVIHEQGHLLGLDHTKLRICRRAGHVVTWSNTCRVQTYYEPYDVMSGISAGHFTGYQKARLHWLSKLRTLKGSGSVTLTPYEKRSPGAKALVVPHPRRSYWLEYRTATGLDSGFPPGAVGVQIHVVLKGTTAPQLLDLAPGVPDDFDSDNVVLAPGSSWRTPEGTVIRVLRVTDSGARIRVRR